VLAPFFLLFGFPLFGSCPFSALDNPRRSSVVPSPPFLFFSQPVAVPSLVGCPENFPRTRGFIRIWSFFRKLSLFKSHDPCRGLVRSAISLPHPSLPRSPQAFEFCTVHLRWILSHEKLTVAPLLLHTSWTSLPLLPPRASLGCHESFLLMYGFSFLLLSASLHPGLTVWSRLHQIPPLRSLLYLSPVKSCTPLGWSPDIAFPLIVFFKGPFLFWVFCGGDNQILSFNWYFPPQSAHCWIVSPQMTVV